MVSARVVAGPRSGGVYFHKATPDHQVAPERYSLSEPRIRGGLDEGILIETPVRFNLYLLPAAAAYAGSCCFGEHGKEQVLG